MLLLPSPLTASKPNLVHVHTTFWEKAKEYVRGGGVLYVSLNGESPRMRSRKARGGPDAACPTNLP